MREKLIELLKECFDTGRYSFDDIADHLIANGVTITVRCKDCKFWKDDILRDDDEIRCCFIGMYMTKGDNFCSFGKKIEGE